MSNPSLVFVGFCSSSNAFQDWESWGPLLNETWSKSSTLYLFKEQMIAVQLSHFPRLIWLH